MRKIYDRNTSWRNVYAYLFKASYSDQQNIEFQVDPRLNQYEAAKASTWLATFYGKIPKPFRDCVRRFQIVPGNKSKNKLQVKLTKIFSTYIFNHIYLHGHFNSKHRKP